MRTSVKALFLGAGLFLGGASMALAVGVTSPNIGRADLQGDFIREIARAVSGGRKGPIIATVSAITATRSDYYACDATSNVVTITGPTETSTPLGTTIKIAKVDSSGNSCTFAGSAISNGSTTDTNTVQGTAKTFTLGVVGTTLTWIAS